MVNSEWLLERPNCGCAHRILRQYPSRKFSNALAGDRVHLPDCLLYGNLALVVKLVFAHAHHAAAHAFEGENDAPIDISLGAFDFLLVESFLGDLIALSANQFLHLFPMLGARTTVNRVSAAGLVARAITSD